jgi:hypothetical protein
VTRKLCFGAAGVVATVIGFAKPIEPMIELGIALIVMAFITNSRAKS